MRRKAKLNFMIAQQHVEEAHLKAARRDLERLPSERNKTIEENERKLRWGLHEINQELREMDAVIKAWSV